MNTQISRRTFLGSVIASGASHLLVQRSFAEDARKSDDENVVRFFFATDTHYLANKGDPARMDETSAAICRRLVETMNKLPGETIPGHAGGGNVGAPMGVIHGGDIVDSADKNGGPFPQMIDTEFAAFEKDYGLVGGDGLLKFPVYEVHGNHDGPAGDTAVIKGIIRRNRTRPNVKHVSPNGLQYSWDWNHVHFINLGIVVGETGEHLQRRRYAPMESLAFLKEDLAKHLSHPKQQVVITQHVDLARYSVPYEKDEEQFLHMEWHPQDVASFYAAIQPYNVIADFLGHTHVRDIFGWQGTPAKLPFSKGPIDVINGDNSSHFHGKAQAFLYVEIRPKNLLVREIKTDDGWESHQWSDQIWGKEILS